MRETDRRLTAAEVLREYEETLPEFRGIVLGNVSQVGHFGNQPIHAAATRGSVGELLALIENGADVEATGEHGFTPLHYAVEQGHTNAVRLLLDQRASTRVRDAAGETPLDLARAFGWVEIIAVLLERGSVA